MERTLVVTFLTHYVVWCAKTRRFDRMRNGLALLIENVGAQSTLRRG